MHRTITVALIALLAITSFELLESTCAAFTPSPPQFTLRYVKYPYDTSPQYTTDPYNGKSIIINEGHHYENESIEVTIKNPPFTSYVDSTGNITSIFYSFRFKGHYSSEWTEYKDYYYDIYSDHGFHHYGFFNSSEGDYTVASLRQVVLGTLPVDAQVDIQVKTLAGYIYQKYYMTYMGDGYYPVFVGDQSTWSNTQTINIDNGEVTVSQSNSPSPSPTSPKSTQSASSTAEPTRTQTETPIQLNQQTGILTEITWKDFALVITCGVIAALAVALLLSRRKRA